MDSSGKLPVRAPSEWDDRGRRGSHQSIDSSSPLERQESSDTAGRRSRSRRSSVTSGPISRQISGGTARQRSTHTDGRLEERRGLAQRLQIFPLRPHSSTASRSSSTNTSSSSLLSLADHAGLEPGPEHSNSYFGTSPSQHSSAARAADPAHPPLSPLSEHPTPSHRAGHSMGDFPVYPDQSYAVLQSQTRHARYYPHLRSRSSYPSQYHSSTASSGPSWPSREAAYRSNGARTAGNTPISSPGLFSPHSSQSSSPKSAEGRPSISYLHPTHLQEPKETHTVEVDRDMVTGNKLINEYEVLDELGRGEHGKVKLGRHLETGKKVAIKIVQRYSKRRRLGKLGNPEDKVKKEVAILKKARHENVVSLLEVIDDPNQQKVFIVLEYVENGEIVWRKKGLREIVVVDKRRLEREKRGIPESPSFIEENQQFVRRSQLRRHQRQISRKKKQLTAAQFSGVPAWSLEHGGESDEEDGPEIPPTQQDNSAHHASPSHSFTSASDLDSRLQDTSLAAVEGSMYGPYAQDLIFERRYSSVSSHFGSESDWLSDDDDMSYVPCLTLAEARRAFRDSVLGLEYLHYQGIIHRDIKPANLLVTGNRRVKISDFGVSYLGRPIRDEEEERVTETDATELDDARELSKTVGTPAFYAPELCYTGNEFENAIGKVPKITGAIDVWSLGVTLYGMIYGRLPFVCDDEFSLFQNIVKHDVFIPSKRLKAVEVEPSSARSSAPQLVMNSNKRTEDELAYEDVDDELRDLLRRLLTKDPTKRITLKEIKHHPWVLRDIPDRERWIETTDPSYQSKGKRIEVSNEEVTRAIAKMPFIERVRSNVARWSDTLFGRSKEGRKRATSSANSESMYSTSSSSSVTVGKEAFRDSRRKSLRGADEEPCRSTITRSTTREGEHPLSHSVLASPDGTEERGFFRTSSNTGSISQSGDQGHRPDHPERASSNFSTAASVKTIRPLNTNVPQSQPKATTPNSETISSSSISGIFGGAGRRLARGLQNREWRRDRSRSTDRLSVESDGHSNPVVAVTTASATGQVQSPDLFREASSTSLVSSQSHDNPVVMNTATPHRRSQSYQQPHDSSVESFHIARDTLRRQRSQLQDQVHPPPALQKHVTDPASLPDREPLPPKDMEWHHMARDPAEPDRYPPGEPMTSPPSALTMSSSSADELNSGMSHCASHPSIPSVISGASSLSAEGFYAYKADREKELDGGPGQVVPPLLRTGDTVTARNAQYDNKSHDDELKYDCDDEDEDESGSEDEGIVFGKRDR